MNKKKILKESGYSLAAEAIVAAFLYHSDGNTTKAQAALASAMSFPDMQKLAQRLYDENEAAMTKVEAALADAEDEEDDDSEVDGIISEASEDDDEIEDTDDEDEDEDETIAGLEIASEIINSDDDDSEEETSDFDFDDDDGDAEADRIDHRNDDDDKDEMSDIRGSRIVGKKSEQSRSLSNLQAILNAPKKK